MCIKLILCYKSILAIVEKQIPIFSVPKGPRRQVAVPMDSLFSYIIYHHDRGWGNSSSICSRTPTFIEMSSCTSSLAAYGIVMAVTSRVLLHVWQ